LRRIGCLKIIPQPKLVSETPVPASCIVAAARATDCDFPQRPRLHLATRARDHYDVAHQAWPWHGFDTIDYTYSSYVHQFGRYHLPPEAAI